MSNSDAISVSVVNNSGSSLYIALNRADGPWLSGLNGATQSWTSTFGQATCVAELTSATPFAFSFPEYNTGVGCRMYISDQTLTGVPDLTTAKFIYDKVEMGWNATWNQTSVDFFAIPLQLESGGVTVGYNSSVTRSSIFTDLAAMPAPYNTFTLSNTDKTTVYRYFSPGQASSMTAPPWSFNLGDPLGQAIATGLPLLAKYTGTFNYGGFKMSGFQAQGSDGLTATVNSETITLSQINSQNSFMDEIVCSPNDASGQKLAGIIGAAINRGVLYDPTKWGQDVPPNNGYPSDYYVKSTNNDNQFNYYSQALHKSAIDNKVYAISYDDFFQQAAALSVNGGDSATITILPFA